MDQKIVLNQIYSENMQLRIDQLTYDILYSDYQYFGFKSMNLLINHIISRYAKSYIKELERKQDSISNILNNYLSDHYKKNHLLKDLLTDHFKQQENIEKKNKALKIHVNSSHEYDFIYIMKKTEIYQNDIGFPEIIRDILYKYSKMSRAQRELVLYQDIYHRINHAIEKKHAIELYIDNHIYKVFHPYRFIHPLDDEGYYILGETLGQRTEAIPLHMIKKTIELIETSQTSTETIRLFKEMNETKFSYSILAKASSTNIIETVKFLKELSHKEMKNR